MSSGRIPALDGLRAISILIVLSAHQAQCFSGQLASIVGFAGSLGVRVFFVISGLLITTLLLSEKTVNGRISLSQFYIRRSLRILPAFYTFVLVVAVLQAMNIITLPPGNLWFVVTYTVNYSRDRVWWTNHLWSLSVEEQFYLIWPLMVRFLSLRTNAIAACALVGVAPVLRFLSPGFDHSAERLWQVLFASEGFFLAGDAIACGCLLAIALPHLQTRAWFKKLMQSRAIFLLPPILAILHSCALAPKWFPPRLHLLIAATIVNVGITLCVARFTQGLGGAADKILSSKFLTNIGLLSYSLYLWQQIFINPQAHSILQRFPVNILLTFVAATLSYCGLERPLLELRKRFRVLKIPTSPSACHEPVGTEEFACAGAGRPS